MFLSHQNSLDLAQLQDQIRLGDELMAKQDQSREEADSLRSRLKYAQENSVSRQIVVRLEARIAELQSVNDETNANNIRLQVWDADLP